MERSHIDETDRKILRMLQRDGESSIAEVAAVVGLSHTPVWRRIKRLQEAGILGPRRYRLDPERIGMDISILVFVKLDRHSSDVLESFEAAVQNVPEILQCYTMSGEFDYLLRVVVASVRDYEKAVKGRLLHLPHVGNLNSYFALNEIKNSQELPL